MFGSVHLYMCVCVSELSCLNRLTLIFGMVFDLNPGKAGIVGQGRRSKFKVISYCLLS